MNSITCLPPAPFLPNGRAAGSAFLTLALFVFGALHVTLSAQSASEIPMSTRIRVLVKDAVPSVELRGLDLEVTDSATLHPLLSEVPVVRMIPVAGHLMINGEESKATSVLVASPSIFVTLGQIDYRSPLEVRIDGDRLQLISHMDLEEYLPGILAGEVPAHWPVETLKAQAVAARTYAASKMMKSRGAPFDVTGDVKDQVYAGASAEEVMYVQAVRLTRGVVLSLNGSLAEVNFHSICGGSTEVSEAVWPSIVSGLPSVVCQSCKDAPNFKWTLRLTGEELAKSLKGAGVTGGVVSSCEVYRRTPTGRAQQVIVQAGGKRLTLDGNAFRKEVGYSRLKSTRFVIWQEGGVFVFQGEGAGHGVGLCQWGARGLGIEGKSAEEILDFYYPGTQRVLLESLWSAYPSN